MAGHSKWANIKHKKAAQDARRGKTFSKIVKYISSAARRGGGDPDTNPELRLYIGKARDVNMPADNIERAILKATGQLEGVSFEDYVYEGYGPGGVAIMVAGSTDNRNRTVANIRHAFAKNGGNMGENGCVGWMFHEKGIVSLEDGHVTDLDALMELALEHGAEEFEHDDGVVTITCAPGDFMTLREALTEAGYVEFITDEITRVAETQVTPDLEAVRANLKLLDVLDDDDDVDNVYHNLELSDDIAAALEAET